MSSKHCCKVAFPVDDFKVPVRSDWELGMSYSGKEEVAMGVNFKKGKINFGIIEVRAEFYLRIARELSDIFNVLV